MTREEAAGVIKFEKACVLRQDTPRCNRDCKKCDLLLPTEDVLTAYDMAIKALEQEPSREFEDYENCKECRKDWTKCGTCSVMMQWLKDNKQEPCEDCISREKLDKALYENFHEEDSPNNITDVRLGAVRNFIRNFPSINPQEPKLDTLDKVRAEIRALSPEPTAYDVVDGNPIKDAVWETLYDVLRIIDKYKAESEDKA